MDKTKITDFIFSLRIPDTAQIIVSLSPTKASYRFYSMPTLEDNNMNFDTKTYEDILDIIFSESDNSRPMPEDLDVQAYIYEDDKREVLPEETLTHDKLELIINRLMKNYPEFSMLRGFL